MSRVTEAQIKKFFHQSNLIEGFDRADADDQSMLAWRHLQPLGLKDLTHYDICKVQRIITLFQDDLQPEWRGHYRKIPVWIAGEKKNNWGIIPAQMDNWLQNITTQSPIAAHVDFEHIHPFVDGNGRTGRMLMWWAQMKRDEELTEITFAERLKYYKWFQTEEKI